MGRNVCAVYVICVCLDFERNVEWRWIRCLYLKRSNSNSLLSLYRSWVRFFLKQHWAGVNIWGKIIFGYERRVPFNTYLEFLEAIMWLQKIRFDSCSIPQGTSSTSRRFWKTSKVRKEWGCFILNNSNCLLFLTNYFLLIESLDDRKTRNPQNPD